MSSKHSIFKKICNEEKEVLDRLGRIKTVLGHISSDLKRELFSARDIAEVNDIINKCNEFLDSNINFIEKIMDSASNELTRLE